MSVQVKTFFVTLGTLCALLLLVVSKTSWRANVRHWFVKENPIVLSTIERDYFEDGRKIVFAKIKTLRGLFIDVYEKVPDGFQKPISRVRLPDDNDGFFHFRGQATNLALEDIDGDGRDEILAPSFDENHVAHLNVYTYNPATEQFEMLPPNAVND